MKVTDRDARGQRPQGAGAGAEAPGGRGRHLSAGCRLRNHSSLDRLRQVRQTRGPAALTSGPRGPRLPPCEASSVLSQGLGRPGAVRPGCLSLAAAGPLPVTPDVLFYPRPHALPPRPRPALEPRPPWSFLRSPPHALPSCAWTPPGAGGAGKASPGLGSGREKRAAHQSVLAAWGE